MKKTLFYIGLLSSMSLGGSQTFAQTQNPPKKWQSTAPLNNGFRFGLDVSTENLHSKFFKSATKPEIHAFVKRDWKINPGDTPADPPRAFWSGKAIYSAYALRNNSTSPAYDQQAYKWGITGDGSLLPPDPTRLALTDPDVSYFSKELIHDLGEMPPSIGADGNPLRPDATRQDINDFIQLAQQFPKKTFTEVTIKKEGDNSADEIKSKAEINWYTPHGSVFEFKISIELLLPAGEVFDPSEVPGKPGDTDLPDYELEFQKSDMSEEGQVEFYEKVKLTPGMVIGAGRVTVVALIETAVEVGATRGVGKIIRALSAAEAAGTLAASPRFIAWAEKTIDGINRLRVLNGKIPIDMIVRLGASELGIFGHSSGATAISVGSSSGIVVDDDIKTVEDAMTENWENNNPNPTPVPTQTPSTRPTPVPRANSPRTATRTRRVSRGIYFLYAAPTTALPGNAYLDNNNPKWPDGYYLTTLTPAESQLFYSRGEHSFALFGNPYEWKTSSLKYFELKKPQTAVVTDKGELFDKSGHSRYYSPNLSSWTIVSSGIVQLSGGPGSVADIPAGEVDDTPNQVLTNEETLAQGFGNWSGTRGNSGWMPRGDRARAITGGQRVPFHRNYPDFSQWVVFSHDLDPLQRGEQDKRGSWDFKEARREFALAYNLRNADGSQMVSDTAIIAYIDNLGYPLNVNSTQQIHDPRDTSQILKGYTWHHNIDMKKMELVPYWLHNSVNPHKGGASFARNARW